MMEINEAKPISVSVSPLFHNLLRLKGFSPTEVFRVGMAVKLAEVGDLKYSNALNLERLEKARKELARLEAMEEISKELYDKEALIAVYKNLKSIKKLIGNIDHGI